MSKWGKFGLDLSMSHAHPYSDTAPQAMEPWLRLLRGMSPAEKLASVFELIHFAREIAAAGVRSRYPAADDREVFLRVAALSHPGRNDRRLPLGPRGT
jgi:hypothetical protein